jgi:hypothetical protein
MKKYRLQAVILMVLLCLSAGLVLAQDATQEPLAAAPLPPNMENSLVPCEAGVAKPCDMIATKPEDIVGVWKQYLGDPSFNASDGMAYIRYNADGTFTLADTVEHTAAPYESYPRGTFHFDGAQFVIDPVEGIPAPCDGAGNFQLRVVKYGDEPVSLRYVPISDACTPRLQDLSQALIWVAE